MRFGCATRKTARFLNGQDTINDYLNGGSHESYIDIIGRNFVRLYPQQFSFELCRRACTRPASQSLKGGGKPLMSALNDRMTMRTFSGEKLPMQTLSNLLWAAFGINRSGWQKNLPHRPETGRRLISSCNPRWSFPLGCPEESTQSDSGKRMFVG